MFHVSAALRAEVVVAAVVGVETIGAGRCHLVRGPAATAGAPAAMAGGAAATAGPAVRRAETTKGRARRGQSPRTSELPTEEKRATAAYHSAGRGAFGTIATQHQGTAAVPITLANTHENEDP